MLHESMPDPRPAPAAISRFGPLIALLTSIAMCVQSADLPPLMSGSSPACSEPVAQLGPLLGP